MAEEIPFGYQNEAFEYTDDVITTKSGFMTSTIPHTRYRLKQRTSEFTTEDISNSGDEEADEMKKSDEVMVIFFPLQEN